MHIRNSLHYYIPLPYFHDIRLSAHYDIMILPYFQHIWYSVHDDITLPYFHHRWLQHYWLPTCSGHRFLFPFTHHFWASSSVIASFLSSIHPPYPLELLLEKRPIDVSTLGVSGYHFIPTHLKKWVALVYFVHYFCFSFSLTVSLSRHVADLSYLLLWTCWTILCCISRLVNWSFWLVCHLQLFNKSSQCISMFLGRILRTLLLFCHMNVIKLLVMLRSYTLSSF